MGKILDQTEFVKTASRGLDGGAYMRSASTMLWDIAGKCASPLNRTVTGRSRPQNMKVWQHTIKAAQDRRDLELTVRCGKCSPCLRSRAARWRHRAQRETNNSKGRTWFVTLTLSPEEHFRMLVQASAKQDARLSTPFESLTADQQFSARHREVNREITLWMKRVRKEYGSALRFCLVAEAHKSGLPHYHALIHEGETPLRAKTIRQQWRLGFSTAKLVAQGESDKSAAYVAKYLAKSAIARVRASKGYGQSD